MRSLKRALMKACAHESVRSLKRALMKACAHFPLFFPIAEESLRKKDGTLNLKGKTLATPDEFEMLKTFLLSLNKKFSLKVLNLDYCDLTDEKLEKLIPLMVKFQKVTLNGSQKISSQGWDNLGQAIKTSGTYLILAGNFKFKIFFFSFFFFLFSFFFFLFKFLIFFQIFL